MIDEKEPKINQGCALMPAKITPGNNCMNCSKRKRCPNYIASEMSWCSAYRKDQNVKTAAVL
jgi:hypothetical protein